MHFRERGWRPSSFNVCTLVKDNRTGYESSNVQAVMDGDLDGFIFAYLKAASRGELKED